MKHAESSTKIALFSTCLVELMRPEIGAASIRLLESWGEYEVVLPPQSCCGQPNINAGDIHGASRLAKNWIQSFDSFSAIVVPSGSCAATIVKDYPDIFSRLNEPDWLARAEACAAKTWELSAFLGRYLPQLSTLRFSQTNEVASYHDSCSGLRKLGIRAQPRVLLETLIRLKINEMSLADTCCGFGGAFCVKQPEISTAMADDKLASAATENATLLLGGDWGCLMHLQGRATQRGKSIQCQHFAELLAAQIDAHHRVHTQ